MVQLCLSMVCVAGHNKDKDYRYIFIINGKIKSLLTQHKSIEIVKYMLIKIWNHCKINNI